MDTNIPSQQKKVELNAGYGVGGGLTVREAGACVGTSTTHTDRRSGMEWHISIFLSYEIGSEKYKPQRNASINRAAVKIPRYELGYDAAAKGSL